jgi:hypothetical protein
VEGDCVPNASAACLSSSSRAGSFYLLLRILLGEISFLIGFVYARY